MSAERLRKIQDFGAKISGHLEAIRGLMRPDSRERLKITLFLRFPDNPEAECLVTDEKDPEELILALRRRMSDPESQQIIA